MDPPTSVIAWLGSALKLVMEPISEPGFYASSYAYRPGRRTQDAIAEIHHFAKAPSNYE